jgi:hypothetical protein
MMFGILRGRSERQMRSFLINKNLCIHYWLRKRIGKKRALWTTNAIEKMILLFGREVVPVTLYGNKNNYSIAKFNIF